MNQCDRIIRYINEFGSITPMEAFSDLGVTKLATRISEMSQKGVEFDRQFVKSKNRYGQPVYYMRYSLRD